MILYENLPDQHFREEIEKQKAKERYMKMHLAGKTDQAKADLARLAIIRKQREEAAKKKEEERKGKLGAHLQSPPKILEQQGKLLFSLHVEDI